MGTLLIGDDLWEYTGTEWQAFGGDGCDRASLNRDIDAGVSTPRTLTRVEPLALPATPWPSWTFETTALDACGGERSLYTTRLEQEDPESPAGFTTEGTWEWSWDVELAGVFAFQRSAQVQAQWVSEAGAVMYDLLASSLTFTFLGATATLDPAVPAGTNTSIPGNEGGGALWSQERASFAVAWDADAETATLTYGVYGGIGGHFETHVITLTGPFAAQPAGPTFPLSITAFYESTGPYETMADPDNPAFSKETAFVRPGLELSVATDSGPYSIRGVMVDICGRGECDFLGDV